MIDIGQLEFIVGGVLAILGVFVALVGWVAVRIVGRLDTLTDLLHSEFKDLLHMHDKRITSLEEWRLHLSPKELK